MKAKLIRTSIEASEKIKIVSEKTFEHMSDWSNLSVIIDSSVKYQQHLGFGGAFTEAAASTLSVLDLDKQEEVVKSYYDESGLNYDLGRVHINSSDFSINSYTYVDDNDEALKTFDIKREDEYVIPMIKKALKHKNDIKIVASPWSPPAWMKDNNNMLQGGKLLPKYYQSWANYYVKYINEFAKRDIKIWSITVQNEPEAKQKWESCLYSGKEESEFVKNYLGPTIEKHNKEIKSDVKIIGWDHNRDVIIRRAYDIFSDESSSKYFWGIATHWYVSEEFTNLSIVHEMFPDKTIIFTEGCQENGPKPYSLSVAERYARNIIGDFNNWVAAWIDWNLVLNEEGGPNHVGNYCDAPILINRKTHEVTYNHSYFYIGHFSKFIMKDSYRIKNTNNLPNGISLVTYQNPNQEIIVVILNETKKNHNIMIKIGNKAVKETIIGNSINTIMIK